MTMGCARPNNATFTINTAPSGGRNVAVSYTAGGASWTFRPSSASSTVWLDDEHYLYFGWWQETPDEADGVYDFHLIAGVGENSRWGAGDPAYSLKTGSAVYTGPAVGKYARTIGAHDEIDHAGELRREAVAGIFTADARLEANFGTTRTVKGNNNELPGRRDCHPRGLASVPLWREPNECPR